jgi:hypothetical protein
MILLLFAAAPALGARPALISSLSPEELHEYDQQPQAVRELISDALALAGMNLTYLYGSNNPRRGGMDCSGTVQHLLEARSLSPVPRQADQIHDWVERAGTLRPVTSRSLESAQFDDLSPGDLLFWSGTYNTDRDITHVMIYLGTDKSTGKPLMVGASDGRRYNGMKRRGVSVFDFRLPRAGSKSRFVGYARIPGLASEPRAGARITQQADKEVQPSPLVF